MYKIPKEMKPFFNIAEELMNGEHSIKKIYEIGYSFRPNNNIFIYRNSDNKKIKTKYSEFKRNVLCYAESIKKALNNIDLGSFVALKLVNSPTWVYCFWALLIAGYKPLLINPITLIRDTEYLLHEAGAKAIIAEEDSNYSVNVIKPSSLVITKPIEKEIWEDEVAFCTSGTTGKSRVFVFNGDNITYQIFSAYCMPEFNTDVMYDHDLRLITLVPFSHIFGFVSVLIWGTFFGRTLVFPKSNAPEDLLSCCKEDKISHIYAVPLFWNRVAKSFLDAIASESDKKKDLVKKFIDYNNKVISKTEAGKASFDLVKKVIQNKVLGSSLRFCVSGGSCLSKSTSELINGLGYKLYNGYGMTEIGITSVELSMNDVKQRNKVSIGKPLTNIDYKIVNKELIVKSPQVHSVTLVGGKRVKSSLDKDGYFHTGDIAICDDEGSFYIKGKLKDIIIGSNGENIYPEEIETHFKSLENVDNFVIVGIPFDGVEKVTMVLEINKRLDKEQIKYLESQIAQVNSSLPIAMQVQEFYLSTTPLPINPSMKIMKYQLVDDMAHRPETFIRLGSTTKVEFDGYDEDEIREVITHLVDIFSDILNIEKVNVGNGSHFILDLGGDSFTYMSLIASVECEFEIKIPTEMIGRLNSVNEFASFILKNKKN